MDIRSSQIFLINVCAIPFDRIDAFCEIVKDLLCLDEHI